MKSNCVIGSIRHISSMIDKFIGQEVKKMAYPISKNHILLFYILPSNGEKMIFNVLCNKWGISKSSLSDIINKYTDLKLVEKHECQDDKRVIYIQLTTEGEKVKNELLNIQESFMSNLFKGLDMDQQETFRLLLNQVEDNISF